MVASSPALVVTSLSVDINALQFTGRSDEVAFSVNSPRVGRGPGKVPITPSQRNFDNSGLGGQSGAWGSELSTMPTHLLKRPLEIRKLTHRGRSKKLVSEDPGSLND